MDASQVTVGSLKRNFPALLGILADVTRHPSFPAEEIERQRKSRLASLVQQRENPGAVATTAMYAALYGPDHPYGHPELGTEASNVAMTRQDMEQFWARNFVPNNAALIVSGQVSVAELRPLVEEAFGGWQRGEAVRPSLGEPETTPARLVIVDKPGAPQTQLRVASIGVPRSTADYEPVLVMNEALGGLFSSRINMNLREQHGYTYGARSQFVFRKAAGPFLVASGVRTDVTAPAVSEIFKEVRRMREEPLPADELSLARDAIVRSLPSQFETSGRVAASTSNIYVYDLGLDYYTKLPDRLSAVTPEQVQAMAQKYVVPERLVVVAVGDRERIAAPLQGLDLGRMEIRDEDGQVVAAPRGTR
jgi:zinc protease